MDQCDFICPSHLKAADMHSTSRVLVCIVQLCFKNKDWNALNEHIVILTKRRSQLKQVWGMVLCTDDFPDFLSPRQKKWSYCNLCKNFCTGKSWHDCNLFYLIFGECFAFFNEMFRTLFGNMIRMSITVQSSDWLQCFTFS